MLDAPLFDSVLVVENVVLFRRLVSVSLTQRRIAGRVVEAGSVAEAHAAWSGSGPFALVIADIHLADGSGLDFVSTLAGPLRPKIVIASGRIEGPVIRTAMAVEPDAFLSKQEDLESFLDALRAVAKGRRYHSPEILESLVHPAGDAGAWLEKLTTREAEVAKLVSKGRGTKEIATELQISAETVKVHRHNLRKKLGLEDAAALRQFLENGKPYSD